MSAMADDKICERCGKSFTKPDDFRRHQNRKTKCDLLDPTQKPHACELCKKRFSSQKTLLVHIKATCARKKNTNQEAYIRVLEQQIRDMKKVPPSPLRQGKEATTQGGTLQPTAPQPITKD